MDIEEELIDQMEERIPALSGCAIEAAYGRAVSAGLRVLESIDGAIVEVTAPGTPTLKRVEPDFQVGVGRTFRIR